MLKKFDGKAWFIVDHDGKFIDNIDTDQIFHNKHLAITDITKMGVHAFGNLKGWEDFPEKVQPNDIIIVGDNFGAGSSRQQAVDCFRALGISVIVGKSFGSIYKRNAINSGFPILIIDEGEQFFTGDESIDSPNRLITIDLESCDINDSKTGKFIGKIKSLSQVEREIYAAGDIFRYGKKLTD